MPLSEASQRRHMMLMKRWLMFMIFILWYSTSNAITCNFLTKNQQGYYVESFGPCDPSASYCASRVVTSSGWQKPVIELFEWYCENEYNITSYLRTSMAPNQGCFTYAHDEHLCFCNKDMCNTWQNIHGIFVRYSNAKQRITEARNANLARSQRQRIQRPEIGRQLPLMHTTTGNHPIGRENTQRRDKASRVVLRTIGDVTRRTVLATQEKQRLIEFKRQQAIRLEAEKERRVQINIILFEIIMYLFYAQKEHEEALREDNRRRYALKLAQREKENQKKEEILKHAKEDEKPMNINETIIMYSFYAQKEHEEALREDNRRRYALKLAQREKENQKKEEILKHAKEDEKPMNINETVTNKSNEGNEKKIDFDGNISDITADSVKANAMIEPAHIVFVNTSRKDITQSGK
uniref:Uncharacterized protein n=1 Tax=Ascaris lumbricoides TaxID=6252 RepID=A0A0M3I2A8_ASCLU